MKATMKSAWTLTRQHFPLILFLFLYRFIIGFILYRFIDNIVVPILHRYPSGAPIEHAQQIFLTEAQFQLTKTNMIMPYLCTLVAIIAVRMLITPFIHSGLFHSIQRQIQQVKGTRFREGIRTHWKKVSAIYWLGVITMIVPAIWLLPILAQKLTTALTVGQLLTEIGPWLVGWGIYALAIHLFSVALQVGIVAQRKVVTILQRTVSSFIPYLILSVLLWVIGIGVNSLFSTTTLLWAGFAALVIHQISQLVTTWMKVWTLTAQSHFLLHKLEQ
ncbi:hypothetical protein ACFSTH_18385 [Paenibacillus yanchengensis]|uniref:Uncharacterized protein n=1 Tax=Paenibacillus yanchengensis TaxID=2035833 RepID=A0ABW4YP79_9BACL